MMEMFDAELGIEDKLWREHREADGRPFNRKISPLKDLAGIKAAVALYCSSFKKLAEWEQLHTFKYGRRNDIICNLALPFSIKNMLGRYVNYTIDEIIEWGNHHRKYSVITYQTCAVIFNNHFCEIVWTCDGEIDYRKTALKMLSNPDLEEHEKFKIAASHCLENHMRKMWPLKSPDKMESLIAEEADYSLTYYWYDYFKSKVYELGDRYFEEEFWHLCDPYYTPPIRFYFCKRVPSHFLREYVISKIGRGDAFLQKNILLEMNASQQLSIIKEVGGRIMVNFTLKQHDLQYAMLIWEYLKNTINQEQYLHILTNILLQSRVNWNTNCNLSDFIDIMWKTTPSGLKHYASDIKDGAVINLLTSHNKLEFCEGAQFAMLVSILPNIELCWRQDILHKISSMPNISLVSDTIFESLILHTERPLLLDKFVKLCIPNSEEQAEFKKKWISSKFINYYAKTLFRNGEWDELEEFITIFESNTTNLAEYKIHLLTYFLSHDCCARSGYSLSHECCFDKDDWPHTPSHEWKRFCSGIDEESLIAVLTNFREGTYREERFLVLVNMLPNFDLDSRRIILKNMISSHYESTNIFEKLIIWDNQPLLLHRFIKLYYTSTQKQFEFKKKWISENVLIQYCAFLICTFTLEKANEFLALYPPNSSNNFEFTIRVLKSCYEIKNGLPLFAFLSTKDEWMEIERVTKIFLWLRKQKYKMRKKNKRKIFFKIMEMNLRYNEGF